MTEGNQKGYYPIQTTDNPNGQTRNDNKRRHADEEEAWEDPEPRLLLPEERCCISCLQRFASPYLFGFLVCMFMFFQSAAFAANSSGTLTTIEKRFQLKSSQLAPFFIVNDIMGVCLVLFVAYYGHTSHRPRLIGGGAVMVGIGFLLCALPQFIYDTPSQFSLGAGRNQNGTANGFSKDKLIYPVCQLSQNTSDESTVEACTEEEERRSGSLMWQVAWIIIGQILTGVGSAPIMPLSVTYMDDGLKRTSTSVFVALFFITGGIGPLFGFAVSSFSLSKHTDFLREPVYAQPGDPNWLGAWWLSFAIMGSLTAVFGIPIMLFPRRIQTRARREEDLRRSKGDVGDDEEVEGKGDPTGLYQLKVRDGADSFAEGFFSAIRRLVTNLTFMSLICGFCMFMMSMMGGFIFMAKYLETQFGLQATEAPIVFGLIMTPSAFLGNLIGGFVVKKLKLTKKGMARMVVALKPVALLLTPALLFIGCDNRPLAGVTTEYSTMNMTSVELPNLVAGCNADCACPSDYTPICGSDGMTYATPCHAGCLAMMTQETWENEVNSIMIYTNCSCVGETSSSSLTYLREDYTAIPGACPRECNSLVPFIVVAFTGLLLNTIIGNPGFMLQLRAVDEDDRSVAVGLTAMMMRLLGMIPSPIVFGAVIQKACILLQTSCGKTGNCLVYDVAHLRHSFFGLTLGLEFLATVGFTVCLLSIEFKKNTAEGFDAMATTNGTDTKTDSDKQTNGKDSDVVATYKESDF